MLTLKPKLRLVAIMCINVPQVVLVFLDDVLLLCLGAIY